MQPKYQVTFRGTLALNEIPSDWGINDYYEILRLTNYDDCEDLDSQEVKGMALFCLSDLEKEEAASLLLEYVFPEDALSQEQIEEIAYQMEDEKLWENFPDARQQRNFFRVGSLLYRAYSGGFPRPDARQITLQVKPLDHTAAQTLRRPTAALAVELLITGVSQHSLSLRSYRNEMQDDGSAEADTIIWSVKSIPNEDGTFKVVILGPAPSLATFINLSPPQDTLSTLNAAMN